MLNSLFTQELTPTKSEFAGIHQWRANRCAEIPCQTPGERIPLCSTERRGEQMKCIPIHPLVISFRELALCDIRVLPP